MKRLTLSLLVTTLLGLLVLAGGAIAYRGGSHGSSTGGAVRATLDPVSALTGSAQQVADLRARVARHPRDAQLQAQLGIAYLQRARETSDGATYELASRLLSGAAQSAPQNFDAVVGQGSLALSYHEFSRALQLGRRAVSLSHGFSPAALGIVGDAQLELGRYPQAFATFAQLARTRPGLVSDARQSYALELQGELRGAITLMRRAVQAGSGAPENTEWTRIQLAGLLLKAGRIDQASREYAHALAVLPTYARAEAGMGAVAVARGDLAAAERWYLRASGHLPLPEVVAALGDVQSSRGEADAARESFALVRAEQRLFAQSGGNVDLENARFDTDHPGGLAPRKIVDLARRALITRPSIFAHDTLAWALHRAGDCGAALPEAIAATRLHTADPMLDYHLGAIQACLGDREQARYALVRALAKNPNFHPLAAPAARRLLAHLGG